MQEIGQGRSLGIVEPSPDEVAAVLCPRQGDIEKPQPFGQDLLLSKGPVRVALRIKDKSEPPVVFRVMKSKFLRLPWVSVRPS